MSYNRQEIQKEALDVAISNLRCTLAVSMGVGKTYIALQHMDKIFTPSSKFLVAVPKRSIIDSWRDEMEKFDLLHLLPAITFTTYLSLKKQETGCWDCIYLDECHSLLYVHEFFLLSHAGRILGLTGTPPKNARSEKGAMVNRFCPVLYKFGVDEATSSGILNDYKIVVHLLRLNKSRMLKVPKKSGGFWMSSEQSQYDFWTDKVNQAKTRFELKTASVLRMKAMQDFPSKEDYVKRILTKIDSKCIVFANTKAQADRICRHSYYSGNPNSEDNLEKFRTGSVIHLSSVLQLNEGVSIPNLRVGVIMHAYGNNRKSAQRIGRLLRLNPSETATCHILCYLNTIDRTWINEALSEFDKSKVYSYDPLTNKVQPFYEHSNV